jgi:predicted transcriptional regulator
VGKANISFPEGMLEQVDRLAAETGKTRSAFIQEAVARYTAQIEYEGERAERRAQIEQAIEGMRDIGRRMAPGPDGVTLIRQMRDAPPRWFNDSDDGDRA